MSQHVVPVRAYCQVFAALMVLTAVTAAAASFDLGPMNVVVALGIAGFKAALVVLYFMHVRYAGRFIGLVVGAGILWLVILLVLTLADYYTRHWIPSPQGW